MTDSRPVKRALISVYDKTGLTEFARELSSFGVDLVSTGGTYRALKDAGLAVTEVSEVTQFPEMMDGRVKTLHPKIHGGILGRRGADDAVMAEHGIAGIDLVVVSLYPFEETVAQGAPYEDTVEMIDIGGPAMIRSAAKNHAFVAVVTDRADYASLLAALKAGGGTTNLAFRKDLAAKAFARTAAYDAAIAGWFDPGGVALSLFDGVKLRYGENPHQAAQLFRDGTNTPGVATATQLQGKDLSYNNLNDTDAAFELVSEFDQPAIAIIKHANPCGVAQADTLEAAYDLALRCDPVSAFGGIVAANSAIDAATAEKITQIFTEVIIAPEVDDAARAVFAKKKNLRVLVTGAKADARRVGRNIKTIAGGWLVQGRDCGDIDQAALKTVTARAPTNREMADLLFAWKVCKHVKSNAIVYARGGATVGIGAGQMSRLDSARIAVWKAEEAGLDLKGSAVASDAFFPFADGLLAAVKAGATAAIQPGGSVRDDEVIKAANDHDIAMVFTGIRHFRH